MQQGVGGMLQCGGGDPGRQKDVGQESAGRWVGGGRGGRRAGPLVGAKDEGGDAVAY